MESASILTNALIPKFATQMLIVIIFLAVFDVSADLGTMELGKENVNFFLYAHTSNLTVRQLQ